MAQLIVEIHIPLTASQPGSAYPFPWIEEVEEHLAGLDGVTDDQAPEFGVGRRVELPASGWDDQQPAAQRAGSAAG